MTFGDLETQILSIINETDESIQTAVRAKVIQAIQRIESQWNFKYMQKTHNVLLSAGAVPTTISSGFRWKEKKKVVLWEVPDGFTPTSSNVNKPGYGLTTVIDILQKVSWDDLDLSDYSSLNDSNCWGTPEQYIDLKEEYKYNPVYGNSPPESAVPLWYSYAQFYPPPDSGNFLVSIEGYAYTSPYTSADLETPHWLLAANGLYVEAQTILLMTGFLKDKDLFTIYSGILAEERKNLMTSVINEDMEGLDVGQVYSGSQDLR